MRVEGLFSSRMTVPLKGRVRADFTRDVRDATTATALAKLPLQNVAIASHEVVIKKKLSIVGQELDRQDLRRCREV